MSLATAVAIYFIAGGGVIVVEALTGDASAALLLLALFVGWESSLVAGGALIGVTGVA